MIEFKNLESLEKIARENKIILVDNSVIGMHFQEGKNESVIEDVTKIGEFIINSQGKFPLFTTEKLYKEDMEGVKKKIQNRNCIQNRIYKKIKKRKLKILDSLCMLNLTTNEMEKYNFYYPICRKYSIKLSEPDLDLLINGIVVSQTRKRCAILSNDLPILYTLSNMISREKNLEYLKEKINFYIRGENIFNKMKI